MQKLCFTRRQAWISIAVIPAIIAGSVLFINARPGSGTIEDKWVEPDETCGVYPVDIPDELEFAGEKVPVNYFDVREALDMELLVNTYWQSHTMLLIKRANRFFPVIEPVLNENGIPEDMKYMAVAESDLTNAISPADAVGFWQFVKPTAIEYGLEVNDEVDERYHLERSTEAACEFLKKSCELYGNWTMAAASYNMGRRGLNRQVERQKEDYYYDLLLNDETGRYIYRLLALKLILSDPVKYGFHVEEEDLFQRIPCHEVTVDGPVENFADFAREHGTNYKLLKIFNPWLRDNKLTNQKGKTYHINIPQEGYRDITNH
jgi:membrane-bound lytic murein transglycosylase D